MSMAQRPRMAQDGSGARSILHIETGEARLSLRLCLTRFESNTDENLLPSQDRPGICLLHQISPGTSQDMPNLSYLSDIQTSRDGRMEKNGTRAVGPVARASTESESHTWALRLSKGECGTLEACSLQ